MPIDITNAGYLAQAVKNRPVIGWHSFVGPSGFSSTETSSGSSERNLWSPDTYTFWQSTTVSASFTKNIDMDLGDTVDVNYVALVDVVAPEGIDSVNFFVSESDDGSTWTAITQTEFETEDYSTVILYFDSVNTQYLRVTISPGTGSTDGSNFFTVAHVRAGQALVLERPAFVGTSPHNRQVEKLVNRSDSGKYLGSTFVSAVRRYSIGQENNSDSFSREFVEPFLKHCELIGNDSAGPKGSFFYAWRPEEFPEDVYYCGDPESVTWPNYSRPNKAVGVSWSISGVAER